MRGDDVPRLDGVALALRHLLAARVEHEVIHQHVTIRRGGAGGVVRQCIAQCGRDREQRVEPAACLVHALGDVISREVGREHIGVLERIVPLRERHAAGIEPGVDHLVHATHGARAAGRRPGVLIDVRLVRIEVLGQRTAKLSGQLRIAADHLDLRRVGVVHPHRQRCAPVPITRDRPIDVVLEPLSKTAGTHLGRLPGHLRVARDHVVLDRRRLHEPRPACVVQQRCAAAPAVRIRVHEAPVLPQHVTTAKLIDDQRIRILDEATADDRHRLRKAAARIDGLEECEVVTKTRTVVIGTESR